MPSSSPLFLGLIFILLSACATVDYYPPGQGTSAEWQSILANSLERNLKEIPFDPAGKRIDFQVRVLGGDQYQNAVGLEKYVKSLFQEWIVSKGGEVSPGQYQMAIFLPVLGDTAIHRELSYQYIPLYYSERFRAIARFVIVIKDAEGRIIQTWQGGEGTDLVDIYLMRILGPFDVPRPK